MKKFQQAVLALLLVGALTACWRATPVIPETVTLVEESTVREIPLSGPAAERRAEISGMAWCGEHLILLPQYPMKVADDNEPGYVFSIAKSELDAFLTADAEEDIQPDKVPFDTAGVNQQISGFEGFESILIHEDRVYLTIEARGIDGMMGYLVQGTVKGDCERLILSPQDPVGIAPQADLGNMSDETLVIYDDQLFTIYEANGVNVNPDPLAHQFDLSLETMGTLPMPNIEYRITDATQANAQGEFWAINFFFPGDAKLKPGLDQIAVDHGLGVSHQGENQIERLIALKIEGERISLAEKPPIYLALSGAISRNWEGVVRFGEDFLLVTDEYPRTILVYVKKP